MKLKSKKPKQPKVSPLRTEYTKQYKRVYNAVRKINKLYNAEMVTIPIPKPSELSRITKKWVEEAKYWTPRKLLGGQNGNRYKLYRAKLRDTNRWNKRKAEAQKKATPDYQDPEPPTPENTLTQEQLNQLAVNNFYDLLEQYPTATSALAEEVAQQEIEQIGVDAFAKRLAENPEIYTAAQMIATYGGNTAYRIQAFLKLITGTRRLSKGLRDRTFKAAYYDSEDYYNEIEV